MNCNNCTNNNALKEVKIKHVHGNVLRMAIPLTLRTIELVDGEINATDTPFIPSSEHPVKVVFSKGSVSVALDATMKDGNIAYIEEKGKIPVGTYAITVTCNDDNGNPYRFKQNAVLYVADATIEAGIEETIEYEVTTWYLDAAIFLALKGEDGVGIYDIDTQSSGEIGGVNTVTFILTDGRTRSFNVLNGSGAVDSDLDIDSQSPIANSAVTAKFNELSGELADLFGDVDYDTSSKSIRFWDKGKTNVLASLDARPFIKDGMVSNAYISNNTLVITFNTDSGKEAIGVPLTSVFNPNNYYTKTQVDSRIASAVANINLSNYYTKSQVDTLVNGKANIDQRTGELTASQATRVVLDYIVGVYDGEDEPAHEVVAGNVWYDNGQIYHSYTGNVEVEIEPLGEPQSSIVYCNAENNKTYRWTGSEFVQVGGSGSGSGGYEPPVGGIPKSDLAQSVQDTLDDVSNKVDKVTGKGLSTEDYTTAEKQKLAGLNNYDDTEIQAEVDAKYEKPSTGIPKTDLSSDVQASLGKADTALQSSDLDGYATTDDVDDAVAALVSSAPQTLDTLNELAEALGDDPNFATTIATQLGNKVDKESGKSLMTDAEHTKLAGIDPSTYATKTEVNAKQDTINDLDVIRSGAALGATALQSFTEEDPTVPSWAKQQTKPTYTAQEVGAIPTVISTTYANLVTTRTNSQLIAGAWYRITDYTCTTTQTDTQSAGHQFDILVQATSPNTLSEEAKAIRHEGDTYFANANLEAWKIWYCLDNDTTRFAWADTTNGKGVIYRMIDEWGNDCPYDFKNIQFKRYKITATTKTSTSLVGKYMAASTRMENHTVDANDFVWCYTFNAYYASWYQEDEESGYIDYDNLGSVAVDMSNFDLSPFYDDNYYFSQRCGDNRMQPAFEDIRQWLNNIVIYGWVSDISTFPNNFKELYGDYIDKGVMSDCYSNTFGDGCYSNTFGNDCSSNTFGDGCYSNTFGNSCYSNTFGNYCSSNTFGDDCYSNTFGDSCKSNTFGNYCSSNTFGYGCKSNTFGDGCKSNTFGDGCYSNTFGDNCYSNTFGDDCSSNTFSKPYTQYVIVENGNKKITLTSSQTPTSSRPLRNITIAQGVNNTNTTKTISHNTLNDTFRTTYVATNSVEVQV